MNATGEIVGTKEKEGEIVTQLALLENKISGLENYSSRLRDVLKPILNQSLPPQGEKPDKFDSCVSPLSQNIYCFNDRLDVVCDILSDILDGCQL